MDKWKIKVIKSIFNDNICMHYSQNELITFLFVSFQLLLVMSDNLILAFMDQLNAKPTRGLKLLPKSHIL